MVDEEQAARLEAAGEVLQAHVLHALVAVLVQQVGERVAEADDGVELGVGEEGRDVAGEGLPVGFFDDWNRRSSCMKMPYL